MDERLPLFPLGIVLLPGELAALHIFEERYKRLIGRCRETGDAFGIVLQQGESQEDVGCTASIVVVAQEFSDGRLNIIVRGGARFKVVRLLPPDDPLAEPASADIQLVADVPSEVSPESAAEVDELFTQALGLTGMHQLQGLGAEVPLSYAVGGVLAMDTALKQRLLQLREEQVRLYLVAGFLRLLVPRLERWKSREDAIRGNGKGH